MFLKEITKDQINLLPLIRFEGDIELIDTKEKLAGAISALYKHEHLGFDTETRPAFVKGVFYSVSLVQIAIPEKVYLFRLNLLGLDPRLANLFSDPAIKKIGISIRDDIKALQKLAPFEPGSFIDLNNIAQELEVKHEGVRSLTAIFLEGRISKNQQTSNWDKEQLSEPQMRYAATDAWICLEIYRKLSRGGFLDN
ncbi:MAG: 3'-5' exonuclease domain-containing protein 2 [Bacteroidota bacterium]|nr:3'-5' exonuclease domain-containing protein 2 [Bacteroidota bacterium]